MRIFSCKFLAVIICVASSSFCSSADAVEDGSQNADSSALFPKEEPASYSPKLVTESQEFYVREGDSVDLPCVIEELGEYVLLWKRAPTTVLFAGNLKITRDGRLSVEKDQTLRIKGVQTIDAGDYICQISTNPPLEVTHKVIIKAPPQVNTKPENGHAVVKKGDELRLICEATGFPKPTIVWRKIDDNLRKFEEGTSLVIRNADRKHSGNYECNATNVGGSSVFAFRVQVLYKPEMEVKEKHLHAPIGSAANLTCIVYAEPPPRVEWLQSGRPIVHAPDKYAQRNMDREYTLQILDVKLSDYHSYTCVANNTYGVESRTIDINGAPSKAVFLSESIGPEKDSFELTWEVKSSLPITSYVLRIRKVTASESVHDWEKHDFKLVADADADQTGTMLHKYSFKVTDLEPHSNYEAIVTSENSYGQSPPSDLFPFTADGDTSGSWSIRDTSKQIVFVGLITIIILSSFF